MILVVGTPNSGKSAYAESLLMDEYGDEAKAYIATMEPYGEEGQLRIKRHRQLRSGKNFVTFEQPRQLCQLTDVMKESEIRAGLLECVSNLVGNEMYCNDNADMSDDELCNLICDQIIRLDKALEQLYVVTNVFDMDESFDDETRRYVMLTDMVNDTLAKAAHTVYRM